MRDLPRGTVTFLFTDIEGSTRLLDQLGAEAYGEALAEHRRVLRDAFGRYDGVEVDTQGDAFFVAFPTAPGALEAAREAQQELKLPVRMGLHTGAPLLTEEGYVGSDVHRAARIAAAGHGRQILLSAAASALVDTGELRDLGEHRLKDLSAPERIYQLGGNDFPPLKTLYRTNLPIPATPFLGREEELRAVSELLDREDVRLLTLSGAGGSGKTRLALQATADAAEAYPDGVWWVPLAPLTDPADVGTAAAQALGGGGTLTELVDGRRLLLLLDNFEHVVEAAPEVGALLADCPRADVIVTSRERLRVQGEHIYPVPVLERAQARGMFIARARAARPDFEPDASVDELCAELDDLPLALELAAARTSLLTTTQLLERLGNRLDLLRGGRDAETRQRTLRATIEWSYELLEAEERRLLAALSIFRGGWTLEAAERVAEADVELMQSLVDKSLVRRWESGRFGMLETIREFAAEQVQPDERDRLQRRLNDFLLDLFEDANLGPHAAAAPRIELAQEERPNVDSAIRWAARADPLAGLELLARLEMFWFANDPVRAREHVDMLLDAAGAELDAGRRARALRLRGATFDFVGRGDLSEKDYLRAIELFRSVGEEDEASHLTLRVASCALDADDPERARRLLTAALDRGGGVHGDRVVALGLLGRAAFQEGDVEEGRRLTRESTAEADAVGGMDWFRSVMLLIASDHLRSLGHADAAEQALVEGLAGAWAVQDLVNVPAALVLGATLAASRNDVVRAGTLWGAAEAESDRNPRPTTARALEEHEANLDSVRGDSFEEARRRGRGLSLEEAVAFALGGRT